MKEEYYIEYYDPKGRRGFTKYYTNKFEADEKAEDLKYKGYDEVKVVTFRY